MEDNTEILNAQIAKLLKQNDFLTGETLQLQSRIEELEEKAKLWDKTQDMYQKASNLTLAAQIVKKTAEVEAMKERQYSETNKIKELQRESGGLRREVSSLLEKNRLQESIIRAQKREISNLGMGVSKLMNELSELYASKKREKYSNLAQIPLHTLLHVVYLLPVSSVVTLASLSKEMKATASNQFIWSELCRRDFGLLVAQNQYKEIKDWKLLYAYFHENSIKVPVISVASYVPKVISILNEKARTMLPVSFHEQEYESLVAGADKLVVVVTMSSIDRISHCDRELVTRLRDKGCPNVFTINLRRGSSLPSSKYFTDKTQYYHDASIRSTLNGIRDENAQFQLVYYKGDITMNSSANRTNVDNFFAYVKKAVGSLYSFKLHFFSLDVLEAICFMLPVHSVIALASISKGVRKMLSGHEPLWAALCRRDFLRDKNEGINWQILYCNLYTNMIKVPVFCAKGYTDLPNIIEVINNVSATFTPPVLFQLQDPNSIFHTQKVLAVTMAINGTDSVDIVDRDLVAELRDNKWFENVLLFQLRRGSDASKFKYCREGTDLRSSVANEHAQLVIVHFKGKVLESPENEKELSNFFRLVKMAFRQLQ